MKDFIKNCIIVGLLVLVSILGYIILDDKKPLPVDDSMDDEEEALTLSASFSCKDNTRFTAEFPGNDTVKIVRGATTQILPLVTGVGQRFENTDFVYVFAGEEVTVTKKSNSTKTTCTQPFDKDNAPVNFGDAGEGGGEKPDIETVVNESVVGKWKLTDDPVNDPIAGLSFYREFRDDGVYIDTIESPNIPNGKTDLSGTWKSFTKEKPVKVSFSLESGTTYMQLSMSDMEPEEIYHLRVVKVTPESLELIYMERGNTLRFMRVK